MLGSLMDENVKEDMREGRTSFERMRTALLAWCQAYQMGCKEQGPIMAFMKDYFLAAYQLTVNDRFFDTPVQATQETTDGRTLGEACNPTFLSEHHCRDCRWFLKAIIKVEAIKLGYTYERIDGFCRRHAPIRVEGSGITDLQWPNVLFEDCCGDWEQEWIDPPKIPDIHIQEIRNGLMRSSGLAVETHT